MPHWNSYTEGLQLITDGVYAYLQFRLGSSLVELSAI